MMFRTTAFLLATLAVSQSAFSENWTRFRGPNGTGISEQKGIPTTWTARDYAWQVKLPGLGHSSPVVWKDKLFVTSAIDEGTTRYLHCLNAATGKEHWRRQMKLNRSHKHKKSSWASATPAVDGERVYVVFADKESHILAVYDFDGKSLWQQDLGEFDSQHGQGVSPMLYKNLVIVPNDQKGPSTIAAYNKVTGELVWKTKRTIRKTSYATPMIFREQGKDPQLICASGAMGLTSLDPENGNLLWKTGEFPGPRGRTVHSPVEAGGLLFQSAGGGGRGSLMVAVDPHGKGDVGESHVKYRRKKSLPYVPTPIAYKGHLYLWNDNGVVSCIEPKTGRTVWSRRVDGSDYSGSPVCIDGKLYCMSEKGNCVVIAASPTYKFYGKVPLGDFSHATPAVANGRLYLRTFHHLYCLEARK